LSIPEERLKRFFLFGNAAGFSIIAFASYFDVYSHRTIFVGTDPWYNPAHIILYSGFVVLLLTVLKLLNHRDGVIKLSIIGILISIVAAGFNEFWHRVLLYGNPLPEPFPIEPPHALLAVGFIVSGVAALIYPFKNPEIVSDNRARIAVSFLSGSLWLIVAGSAFFVGGVVTTRGAILFAIATASFSASLFLSYPAAFTKKFGFATLSYLWYFGVNFLFFLSPSDGFPIGIFLVAGLDYLLVEQFATHAATLRNIVLVMIAALYGLIYFPLLPIVDTFVFNNSVALILLGASCAGVLIEFFVVKFFAKSLTRPTAEISLPEIG